MSAAMTRTPLAIACALLLGIWIYADPPAVHAQELSAGFASELAFQPVPIALTSTEFTLLLGITVADAKFLSQVQFDLTAFQSQLLALELSLGELAVSDRLLFRPAFVFERNELFASLDAAGFRIAAEVLFEELGPPSPDINPGLVIEAGGRSSLGIALTSFTGFGTTQIAEDFLTVLPCFPLEPACLGDGFPDDKFDRLVVKPFLFTEQAVRVEATFFPGITLAVTPLFTFAGLTKALLEIELAPPDLGLRFVSISTIDPAWALLRQTILLEGALGAFGWRSHTVFSGPPILFESQTFKTRVSVRGLSLETTMIFSAVGLSEVRLGVGFVF
jgi:hypothetical protein